MNNENTYKYMIQEIEAYKKEIVLIYRGSNEDLIDQLKTMLDEEQRQAVIEDLTYLQQMLGLIALARHGLLLLDEEGNVLPEIIEDEEDDYRLENCEVV